LDRRELDILRVLWTRGRCIAPDGHEALNEPQRRGYTNTRKLMQLMAEKGLVRETSRTHRYRAAGSETEGQSRLLMIPIPCPNVEGPRLQLTCEALATTTPDLGFRISASPTIIRPRCNGILVALG